MRKLEEENQRNLPERWLGAGEGAGARVGGEWPGEGAEVTKKGQKVKIYWEKKQKHPPDRQNAKIGEKEQEERREGEESH